MATADGDVMNGIEIRAHSGIYSLETAQDLPLSLAEAWKFFSNPRNLARITPEHMGFVIASRDVEMMYPGQIIAYRIGLFPGIKTNWVTEITHVEHERYFVDEQRFGPYAMWHHEHLFERTGSGVRMRDKVSYKLPCGPLGRLAHPVIERQLRRIFAHRRQALTSLFG